VACAEGLDADGHRRRIRATPRAGSTPTAHVALPTWIFYEELCRAALGVAYVDGPVWLRPGFPAIGVSSHFCSVCSKMSWRTPIVNQVASQGIGGTRLARSVLCPNWPIFKFYVTWRLSRPAYKQTIAALWPLPPWGHWRSPHLDGKIGNSNPGRHWVKGTFLDPCSVENWKEISGTASLAACTWCIYTVE
jgi:hypothetical protein